MSSVDLWLQLGRLFDFLEDVQAWVKDRAGRYRWVNRAFVVNYESSRPRNAEPVAASSILGKTDYELSAAFLADQFRLDDEQVLAGKEIVHRIELVGEAEGTAVWHVTNKVPLFDGAGKIVGTAGMTRRLEHPERPGTVGSDFGRVLAYMRDAYHRTLTNQELARVAHMSLRVFERKFLSNFHLPPQQYLRKLRLRMASRALVFKDQPLAEVAQSCGFSDQSHFTREFRKHFGRAPGEYREHYSVSNVKESSIAS